jgi:hypothetical protein
MRVHATHFAQEWAIKAHNSNKEPSLTNLPDEYKRHWKVFSEEEAKHFPPSRGEDDHAINLKPDASIPFNAKSIPSVPQKPNSCMNGQRSSLQKDILNHPNPHTPPVPFASKRKMGLTT